MRRRIVVITLLCAISASRAGAGVIDDLRNLIHELGNAPSHVVQICLDAFSVFSTEIDNYTLSLTNNAVSERGLTAKAAADAVSTAAEVEKLQAEGSVKLRATTVQLAIDAEAQTDQLSRDAGAGLAQITETAAAIKRAQRQGYDSGSQTVTTLVNNLISPLRDYLNDLFSHPWDFSLTDVQNQLAAIHQAMADAPQTMKDAIVQATQNSTAQLRAIVIGLQQKRLEAERLAKAAADALAQDLSQPRVTSGVPQSVDDFVAPDLGQAATRVVTAQQSGVNAFHDQLDFLASTVWVSAQQEQPAAGAPATQPNPQNSGTPAPAEQGSGNDALSPFGTMPNFKVEESEVVEFDYYTFGYLPNTPRLEGRRTTVNYWLIPGNPMPGALGICRHFADATRKAGGEVLYDNNRNIITVRTNQSGRETWAEFACDKDRYRVNIIERESGNGSEQAADASNIMKTKQDTVKNSVSNIVPAAGRGRVPDPRIYANGGSSASDANIPAAAQNATTLAAARAKPKGATKTQGDFNLGNRFSIEIDAANNAVRADPVRCADPPTLVRQRTVVDGKVERKSLSLTLAFANEIRASKLNLVDENTWSCHSKDGTLVQGALITDRPLK